MKARAYQALALATLSLGSLGILVRGAAAPGAVVAFYRLLFAGFALTPPLIWYKGHTKLLALGFKDGFMATACGVCFALDIFCLNIGINSGNSTIPILLTNTAPVWVGLFDVVFYKHQLPRAFWIGLGVTLFGGALVVLGKSDSGQTATPHGLHSDLAVVTGVLSGMFYAGYMIFAARVRLYMPTIDTVALSWYVSISGAVTSALLAFLGGHSLRGYSATAYGAMAASGLVTQVVGQSCVLFAMRHLPTTIVAPSLLAQPVVAAALATVFLRDFLSLTQLFGGGVLLYGVRMVHQLPVEDTTQSHEEGSQMRDEV